MLTNPTSTLDAGRGATASGAQSRSSRTSLDPDAFLRLLVAQLRNQDPTRPVDTAQQVAQMAAISSVEQSIQTNAKLSSIAGSIALLQAGSLIGREIATADNLVSGRVREVVVSDHGAVARLVNGRDVPLGPGVKIS